MHLFKTAFWLAGVLILVNSCSGEDVTNKRTDEEVDLSNQHAELTGSQTTTIYTYRYTRTGSAINSRFADFTLNECDIGDTPSLPPRLKKYANGYTTNGYTTRYSNFKIDPIYKLDAAATSDCTTKLIWCKKKSGEVFLNFETCGEGFFGGVKISDAGYTCNLRATGSRDVVSLGGIRRKYGIGSCRALAGSWLAGPVAGPAVGWKYHYVTPFEAHSELYISLEPNTPPTSGDGIMRQMHGSSISVPKEAKTGELVSFNVYVKNDGKADILANTVRLSLFKKNLHFSPQEVQFYRKPMSYHSRLGSSYDPGHPDDAHVILPAIAAGGESQLITLKAQYPCAGEYNACALVDSTDFVGEIHEVNNAVCWKVRVTGTVCK